MLAVAQPETDLEHDEETGRILTWNGSLKDAIHDLRNWQCHPYRQPEPPNCFGLKPPAARRLKLVQPTNRWAA